MEEEAGPSLAPQPLGQGSKSPGRNSLGAQLVLPWRWDGDITGTVLSVSASKDDLLVEQVLYC